MKVYRLFSVFIFLFSGVMAQHSKPDTIRAYNFKGEITLDGKLNEPVWFRAQAVSNFTQRELNEGETVSEKTRVAVIYNQDNLYVGVWCYDREPDKLIARKLRRDFNWGGDDNFKIIIDSYGDNRNAYLFITNPNAARADMQVLDNGRYTNRSWNGVWDVRTTITDKGWFAEFEIPFTTFKFATGKELIWGINFERNIRRKREEALWQGWSRNYDLVQVSQAGKLVGLKGLQETRMVEIKPYLLSGYQNLEETGKEGTFNIGGDINYLITPTLKLNVTINTDFAQVESDRVRINLTRFSQFYPEKREFFLEGKDYFDFSFGRRLQPFYSRKIGISDDRGAIPIIGGVRVIGKNGRSTIGAMSIQTAAMDSIKTTNYSVLRWKEDIGEQSSFGVIGVSKILAGRENVVFGGDYLYSSTTFLGNKNLVMGASGAGSYTSDALNKFGDAEKIYLDYPNDLIDFYTSWQRCTDRFNPEVGFMYRSNFQLYDAELRITPRPSFLPGVRKLIFKPFELSYYINETTHQMESFFGEFRPLGISFKSGDFIEFNIMRSGENLTSDFEIHEGIVIPASEYWFTRYEFQIHTFSGRPVFAMGSYSWGNFFDGTRLNYDGMVVWRMSKYLSASFAFEENRISLPQGSFIVDESSGRIEYAFTPDLFGALAAQWNNQDDEVIFNYRLTWIPKPGAFFYLVFNQRYIPLTAGEIDIADTAILGKIIWRFSY
jgi:hypothetical protein